MPQGLAGVRFCTHRIRCRRTLTRSTSSPSERRPAGRSSRRTTMSAVQPFIRTNIGSTLRIIEEPQRDVYW
ncbi:enoyl-CoA hydratase, partial [Xanthomonas perforans]|nr:enoyl-CoA hydratase [Xanthomonas perforans]